MATAVRPKDRPAARTLTADLKLPNGTTVATAEIAFTDGYATVTVETTEPGELAPGFHGLHIHSVGKCEANSVAPDRRCARRLQFGRWTFAGGGTHRPSRQR